MLQTTIHNPLALESIRIYIIIIIVLEFIERVWGEKIRPMNKHSSTRLLLHECVDMSKKIGYNLHPSIEDGLNNSAVTY